MTMKVFNTSSRGFALEVEVHPEHKDMNSSVNSVSERGRLPALHASHSGRLGQLRS
jgi:hypothetical protein